MAKLMDNYRKRKKPGAAAPVAPKPPLEEPASATAPKPSQPMPHPAQAAPSTEIEVQAPSGSQSPAPPSAKAPQNQPVIDASVLMGLPGEAFLNFCYSRFNKLQISNPQELLLASYDNPEIALMLDVAKKRNLLGPLLSPASASPERISAAPGSIHTGPEAYEATMASNVHPALDAQPPGGPQSVQPPPSQLPQAAATRVTKPPPPPPRRKSSEPPPAPKQTAGVPLSEICAFIIEIRESGESTSQRFERANAYLRAKVKEIVAVNGHKAFEQAEVSATRKLKEAKNGAQVSFTPLEQAVLDLYELNKFIAWLKKRMSSEGGVHAVLEANNGKMGEAAAHAQPAAALQPAPVPAPAAQAGAAAQKAAAPAAAQAETEKPRTSGPPPAPKPKPGALRRFFSSYTTWSVFGIGAFSGALAYADGYKDMAFGAKRFAELVSGRQVADIPTAWAVGVYGAVVATIFAVSLLVKRSMENRKAERAFKRAQRSGEDRKKMNYVFTKLSEIVLNFTKTEDQKSQIRQAMRTDEELFICMYGLRKDAIFDDILEDARVPDKLRGIISQVMIPGLELELMEKRLRKFADLIYDPKRLAIFEETYEKDPVFRAICDEIFAKNVDDYYIDPSRARAIFKAIENSKKEKVGEPLLKALQEDYDNIIKRKAGKGKS